MGLTGAPQMEGWVSGLNHFTANEAIGKTVRGFESLSLRH